MRTSLWAKLFQKTPKACRKRTKTFRSAKIAAANFGATETLEDRVLLYTTSGNAWPNKEVITISFMPDGTDMGGKASNLQSTFNTKFGNATTWQNQILKAAQYWAQQTNINFVVVPDNGAPAGSGSYQQGDPGFGDIRIGGYNFGNTTLAQAYLPPPVNNYSIAGDIQINTGVTFNVGTQYDLFTVALHEIGHASGLLHSTTSTATMFATYNGVDSALNTDDISGIKAVYSAGTARANDAYEPNASTTAAKVITVDATTKTAVVNNLDLTTSTDLDFFKFTIPSGSSLSLKATVTTTGLSLMNPKIDILNSGGKVVATATAASTDYDGTTLTATFTGTTTTMAAGSTYYAKVYSANSLAAFKTGKYALTINTGTNANPTVTTYQTSTANGTTLSSGGGQALALNASDIRVNTTTQDVQQTGNRAVASDVLGNYVVTWSSANQDGSGWGVYAQRYNRSGVPQGSEFLVNTTTAGDQTSPAVAMDALGNFLIAWTSFGQDGSDNGVYARRFSASGTPLTNEFRVNTTTNDDQFEPSVSMDALGYAAITWTSEEQDGSAGGSIYGQKYDLLGNPDGGEFRVNTTTIGHQGGSSVVMNRLTRDLIVTWQSAGQDGSGVGIYSQRFKPNGTLDGTETRINTYTTGDQIDPSIAINRFTGDYVVTWTSVGQDGGGAGIYAQRFNKLGVVQGTEFRVNTTTAGDQNDSSVALDSGGNILVTWAGYSSTNGWQIYGQQFTNTGVKTEAEMVINTTATGDQNRAAVAIDFLGQVVVAWSGNGPSSGTGSADSSGVYLQRYRTDLHGLDAEGHGHHHDHDEEAEVPVQRDARGSSNGGSGGRQHMSVVAASEHASSNRWADRVSSWKQSTSSESRSQAGAATMEIRQDAAHTVEQQVVNLSEAIDSLFSSEAWLTGRHYRNS